MRVCEKCNIEYEDGLFCMTCGSDLKEKMGMNSEICGMEIFNYSPAEIETIDEVIEPKLAWGRTKAAESEQMALDAARLLSCTQDRLNDYAGQGFFKRCWHKLCGKQGEMQRANQKDLIEMQKYAWRYLNLLQERDLLLAHSLITVKNNLMTLAMAQEDTKNEITRMAQKVYERFVALENRVEDLEIATNIHGWLLTIETYNYDENFPPYFRLLKVVRDFLSLKEENWSITEIKYLQKAVKDVGLPWKEKIRLSDFVAGLIDEIEDASFLQYQELIRLDSGEQSIPASFILENVAVPSFTSLYQIADSYTGSSIVIDALSEQLNISKKEAIKNVLTTFIKKQGIDLEISIPFRDLAVELLTCMKLTKNLFERLNNEQNFHQIQYDDKSDATSATDDPDIPENEKNFEWYLKAAEQGNAEAQFMLGKKYFDGDETERDQQKAFEWYSKAAEQGFAEAQFALADMYWEGEYVEKDYKKTFEWSSKAAEQGLDKAENRLGYMYNYGQYVEKDLKKAFEWYFKAAEQSLAKAECNLGTMYSSGWYVEKDYKKAFEWYLKAAEQGYANAQSALGGMYYSGNYVEKDYKKAFEWYLKAAEQGYAASLNMIGAFYNNGIYIDKNEEKAFNYFMKSAEQNNNRGQYLVGFCYYRGMGVKENKVEALKWYKKACENNSADAMIEIARHCYYDEKNINHATIYLNKAIENKSLAAMAIYSFIKDTKKIDSSRHEANLGYGNYGRTLGELWIKGDNMYVNQEKLENAKKSYAGDLADKVLVLWDATFFGSADEGFLITKDLDIVSHRDKIPLSLLNENPRSVLAKMKYFEGKDSRLIDAIVRLADLVKKYRK